MRGGGLSRNFSRKRTANCLRLIARAVVPSPGHGVESFRAQLDVLNITTGEKQPDHLTNAV
ncbi:MAG: hypothetical protein K0S95_64 [Pantoea eucrina]|jgi:hypothetical protein|nr:hypothetical protein [Pantoea eucrina]